MNRSGSLWLVAIGLFIILSTSPALGAETQIAALAPGTTGVPDQYIVVLSDATTDVDLATSTAVAAGCEIRRTYKHALKGYVANCPPGTDPTRLLAPDVKFIEQDSIATAFDHKGGEIPTGVNRVEADKNPNNDLSGTGWGVAILDSGINLSHPDLNVVGNVTFVAGTTSGADDNGHGSHVAGIVGAKHNASGVLGVAPGSRLYAVKVLNSSLTGLWSDIIKGIDWVTQNAGSIAVAVMALGGPLASADDGNCGNTNLDAVHQAICNSVNAGVVYVVAAGNNSVDVMDVRPAAYREVVTVSALADSNGLPNGGGKKTSYGADDTFATFSNYGAAVDLIAPGVSIKSTCLSTTYCTKSGTSQAAPHAAGAVALWIKQNGRPATANANDPAFRDGILAQTSEAVGKFKNDPDAYAERMVNANTTQTGGTGTSVCCPAP